MILLKSKMKSCLKRQRQTAPMDVMNRDQTLEFLRSHVKTDMLMKRHYNVYAGRRG